MIVYLYRLCVYWLVPVYAVLHMRSTMVLTLLVFCFVFLLLLSLEDLVPAKKELGLQQLPGYLSEGSPDSMH